MASLQVTYFGPGLIPALPRLWSGSSSSGFPFLEPKLCSHGVRVQAPHLSLTLHGQRYDVNH